jgi:hypothetical protein
METTNKLRIGVGATLDKSSTYTVPLNTWVFLVAQTDLATAVFYVNGVRVYSAAATGTMRIQPASPLTLGVAKWNTTYSYYAPGIIGEAFIFNRPLFPSEVSALYRATSGRYL